MHKGRIYLVFVLLWLYQYRKSIHHYVLPDKGFLKNEIYIMEWILSNISAPPSPQSPAPPPFEEAFLLFPIAILCIR